MMIQIVDPIHSAEVLSGVGAIANWVKTWAVPLAAIGTVSMALIQTAKNVLPLRSWFQRARIRRWLFEAARDVSRPTKVNVCTTKAETDLISLATSGDEEAFYNLPIEDLCAQIRNAVPVIMDYPSLHADLFYCLASEASMEDLAFLLEPPPHEVFFKRDQSAENEKRIRAFAAAKARVSLQVRCSVDAIQTSIGFRWKRSLQIASLVLSAAVGIIALYLGGDQNSSYPRFGATIMIGVLSGFLAPVARDLVAGIEKWRT